MSAGLQEWFRAHVRRVWDSLMEAELPGRFSNVEGGSVEQHTDRRLQLHHCVNYAAALTLLEGEGRDLDLLELGCGSGALSAALATAMPEGWRLKATDYVPELVEHARDRYARDNLSFDTLDLRELRPEQLADTDAVLFLEVIEHLSQQDAAGLLVRLHAALPPGAKLVLTTLDRAPFPRPFSGYAPHVIEYTWQSLGRFLGDPANSPFESHAVHRLVSGRIASEAVKAEQRGGYLANRLQRKALEASRRSSAFDAVHRGLTAAGYRAYSLLPKQDRFDLDGYLETITLETERPETHDADSFGLVAVLQKV